MAAAEIIGGATAIASAATQAGSAFATGKMNYRTRKLARQQMSWQAEQTQKANEFNSREAQLARQWQENFYNKYQSPEALMRQKKAAGINPYLDSGGASAASAPSAPTYTQVGDGSAPLQAQSSINQNTQDMINRLDQVASIGHTLFSLQKEQAEAELAAHQAEGADINNKDAKEQLKIQMMKAAVWDMDLEEADLQTFEGYGVTSKWYTDFVAKYNRKPKFGDLYMQAYLKAPGRDLNRRNGFAALETSMPWVHQLIKFKNNANLIGKSKTRSGTFMMPDGKLRPWMLTPDGSFQDMSYDDNLKPTENPFDLWMSSLAQSFAFGMGNQMNDYQKDFLQIGMDTIRKGNMEAGLPTDSSSVIPMIMLMLFRSNPQLWRSLQTDLGKMLEKGVDWLK